MMGLDRHRTRHGEVGWTGYCVQNPTSCFNTLAAGFRNMHTIPSPTHLDTGNIGKIDVYM